MLGFAETGQVGVNGRHGRALVAEVDLDLAEVLALLQQVRGIGMTQRVHVRVLGDATGIEREAEGALEGGAAHGLGGGGGAQVTVALLARIGGETVAIFPSEASYAAVNPIRYRPFPVFQTYQAYTSYLDTWNAEHLEDTARAPAFILFDWDSVDDRHPLLDSPALAVSMLRHYDLDSAHGPHLLLRRRAAPRFGAPRLATTMELHGRQPLTLPENPHPRLARIALDLSASGAARNFFFRLPETTLVAALDKSVHGAKASKPVFKHADTRLMVPWILVRTICSQSVCQE